MEGCDPAVSFRRRAYTVMQLNAQIINHLVVVVLTSVSGWITHSGGKAITRELQQYFTAGSHSPLDVELRRKTTTTATTKTHPDPFLLVLANQEE